MPKFTKRIYLDKQPEVGDNIVITCNHRLSNHTYGTKMTIVSVETYTGDCIFAYNPRKGRVECVHDNHYSIYTDVTYVKTGEKHVVKRFLGIPFYRKTIDNYEEE